MVARHQRRAVAARRAVPWRAVLGELVGTALLVGFGLSVVIMDFATHGPLSGVLGAGPRRALTGFLFGTVGALVAVSPVGKLSGAHLNPVVTLAFRLRRTIGSRLALAYVAAQAGGALLGSSVLLAWGAWGRSVHFGATLPGASYGVWWALVGEVATTLALVVLLLAFVGTTRLRRFTPALFPVLYAVMVFLEAPVSGTSTNPARSLGPAVVSGAWHGWWVYWLGPALGCLVASGFLRLPGLRRLEVGVARVYHFAEGEVGRIEGQVGRLEGQVGRLEGAAGEVGGVVGTRTDEVAGEDAGCNEGVGSPRPG
jgi:aquaporin Z